MLNEVDVNEHKFRSLINETINFGRQYVETTFILEHNSIKRFLEYKPNEKSLYMDVNKLKCIKSIWFQYDQDGWKNRYPMKKDDKLIRWYHTA
jgi:hypothetical protein